EQNPTAIADHAFARTRGVAGIAYIKPGDGHAATSRDDQQAAQWRPPTRTVTSESIRVKALDRVGGPTVRLLTRAIIEVVRKVRRDHDQRFQSAPDRIEQLCHRLRWRIADHDRHQGEVAQHRLQEWYLNLERMLARMRSIEYVNQLFRYQAFDDGPIDRRAAQGCLPSL